MANEVDLRGGSSDTSVLKPSEFYKKVNPGGAADTTTVELEKLPEDRQKAIKEAVTKFREAVDSHKEAEPEALPSAGTDQPPLNCPHCGWDQKNIDPETPSDTDKLNFLQSTLGQTRFYKEYDLMGGHVKVAFRTLTSEEADMCYTQAALDAEAGLINDFGKYLRTLADYRLCLGLFRLDTGRYKHELPDMDGYKTDMPGKKETKLKQIVPHIYDKVLVQEPIRAACAAAFHRFQRMTELLVAHVDDPNFWSAIEGQP